MPGTSPGTTAYGNGSTRETTHRADRMRMNFGNGTLTGRYDKLVRHRSLTLGVPPIRLAEGPDLRPRSRPSDPLPLKWATDYNPAQRAGLESPLRPGACTDGGLPRRVDGRVADRCSGKRLGGSCAHRISPRPTPLVISTGAKRSGEILCPWGEISPLRRAARGSGRNDEGGRPSGLRRQPFGVGPFRYNDFVNSRASVVPAPPREPRSRLGHRLPCPAAAAKPSRKRFHSAQSVHPFVRIKLFAIAPVNADLAVRAAQGGARAVAFPAPDQGVLHAIPAQRRDDHPVQQPGA